MDFRTTLSVKFARTGEIGEQIVDDSSDDMVIIDPSEGELDLKQYIYDYVCINLPLQRVHSEGECNAEVMRILNGISSGAERRESREDSCDNEERDEEADAPQQPLTILRSTAGRGERRIVRGTCKEIFHPKGKMIDKQTKKLYKDGTS